MGIDTKETFLICLCTPQPRTLLQNSSLSSSPSLEKISFQFTLQTFKFILEELQDFLYRIREEAEYPSTELLCICIDAEEVDRGNSEFYQFVYESLERIGIPDQGLHSLATSIVDDASEVKRWESSSNPRLKEVLLKVTIIEANVVTTSDPSTETENTIRESMEEFEEANYGMVPTSEKGKKRMLKSIRVAGEENLRVKDRCDGRERKRRRRESIKEETCTCMVCLEGIPAGSWATQVPCSHVFHSTCIEKWLKVSHYCPMCRFDFPTQ